MAIDSNRVTRRALVGMSFAFSAGLLAACAAPSPTPSPAPAAKPAVPASAPAAPAPTVAAAAPAQATEPVTIRLAYRIGDKPEMYERFFPKFMQENPNIKLVGEPISFGAYEEYFAKLASMMAADNLADVVWVSAGSGPFLSQVSKGFFMPLDDLVKSATYDLQVWYPAALDALRWESKLYALPSDMHPSAQFVYYNMRLFDEAGVAYPASNWTYDDLIAMATKLTTRSGDRTEVFGFAPLTASWAQEVMIRSHGGSYLTADGKKSAAKEESARLTLQWLYDGMHQSKVIPRKQDVAKDSTEMFYTEQAAMTTQLLGMIFSGPSRIADKFKFGVVRLPKGTAGKHGGMVHIGGQAIYGKTKNPDEAFTTLTFITNLENALVRALEFGGTLARRDLFEHATLKEKGGDNWQVVLDAMADPDLKPYFTPDNLRTSELQSVIDQETDAFWTGSTTVANGIDQLDSALNIVLAKPR